MTRQAEEPSARFLRSINKTPTCWVWQGGRSSGGYGYMRVHGRQTLAHRYSLELTGKTIPDGMQVDHICHNRACVNPDHLRLVTNQQNSENLAGPKTNNTSGVLGVGFDKRRNKYRVYVKRDGRQYSGGHHETLEAAEKAAKSLRTSLFTHNVLDRRTA